jgi:hypothetical protein
MLSSVSFGTTTNKKWTTPPGTVYRVFEVYERGMFHADGSAPVFVQPDMPEKKKK